MRKFAGFLITAWLASTAPAPVSAFDFTVADDVEPILGMTKANWIGVREWQGEDLLYFSHLISYRCAIEQVRYFVNVGKPRVREMEECHWDLPQPFIIRDPEGHVIYDKFPLNSIETITVEITLTNGNVLRETFERKAVWIP